MKPTYIIPRFSNLLFFAQRTDQRDKGKHNIQKYLLCEHIDVLFCGKSEKEILGQLSKSVGKQNADNLKRSLSPLRQTFATRWGTTSRQLILWKKYFQRNNALLLHSVSEIKKLNGVKNLTLSRIPIYLISIPMDEGKEINAWFSWTSAKSFIVVEIPEGLPVAENLFHMSVLGHEFFHLIIRRNTKLFSKIDIIAQKDKTLLVRLSDGMPPRLFFEELLVSSFLPEGYLGERDFGIKQAVRIHRPKDLLGWRRSVACAMREKAKDRLEHAKIIDDKYFGSIIRALRGQK